VNDVGIAGLARPTYLKCSYAQGQTRLLSRHRGRTLGAARRVTRSQSHLTHLPLRLGNERLRAEAKGVTPESPVDPIDGRHEPPLRGILSRGKQINWRLMCRHKVEATDAGLGERDPGFQMRRQQLRRGRKHDSCAIAWGFKSNGSGDGSLRSPTKPGGVKEHLQRRDVQSSVPHRLGWSGCA